MKRWKMAGIVFELSRIRCSKRLIKQGEIGPIIVSASKLLPQKLLDITTSKAA
jgi:hypothetical protein